MKRALCSIVLALSLLTASLTAASCDHAPGAAPTAPATSPPPTQRVVDVPAGASMDQIDACLAEAVADGSGTWLVFPAGKFPYSGVFIVPDGITVTGQGIWDQGRSDGGGGTWLQCTQGMDWGSDCSVNDMLVGMNTAGLACTFHPVPRGSTAAGRTTDLYGSRHCTFRYVRFKGGSDDGAGLIDLDVNFGNGLWSGPVQTCDMIDTNWYDCEFERPQGSGSIMNIWLDCRAGGAQVYGNGWYRCHFGVKNGYRQGVEGYGIGQTILFQPAPAEHASDGPRPTGGRDDMSFNWSQVDHGFHDNHFEDCLFEYALWTPMDVCDYARSYALTNLFDGAVGSNPPTATQAAAIPDRMWNIDLSMTRCYSKGSTPDPHSLIGEFGKDCVFTDCFCGTGSPFGMAGRFGNVVSGSFSNADRPVSAIFPAGAAYDWTGTTTSYTPSPYDP
jgi:hypothetical protein